MIFVMIIISIIIDLLLIASRTLKVRYCRYIYSGVSKYFSPGAQSISPGAQQFLVTVVQYYLCILSPGGTTILALIAIVKTKTNQ